MRNINVSLTDDLRKKVDDLGDVNWSAVTRKCIEQYIKQRTVPRIEGLLTNCGKDYKRGFEFVIKNIDRFGLFTIEQIVTEKDFINYLDDDTKTILNGFEKNTKFLAGMRRASKLLLEKSE